MPVIVHEFPIKEQKPVPESEMRWKAKCRHCRFVKENLGTGNGAQDVAHAHSLIHGHDVEFTFSLIDCLGGVIRARDSRD